MQVIEFRAQAADGVIPVPLALRSQVKGRVKVTVVVGEKRSKRPPDNFILHLMKHPLPVKTPFLKREALYERR